MNVFLDANILVTVLNKEYPLFPNAAKILSLTDRQQIHLHTSPICLAIAFYFAAKKHGSKVAKEKISLLIEHINIAPCGKQEALKSAANKKVHDFEDGLEYYSAIHTGCTCIITEDTNDFHFSEIEILNTEGFLKKYFGQKASRKK